MTRVGRDRVKHKRLPKGWSPAKNGVMYFRPTNADDKAIVKALTGGPMSVRLGLIADHDGCATVYADLIVKARKKASDATPGTIAEIVDRGERELLPDIEHPKTREETARYLNELGTFFGTRRYAKTVYDASRATDGASLRSMDVQRHVDACKKTRPVAVNRWVDAGDLLFTWAITRWGLTEYNPFAGVMKNRERPRTTVPSDKAVFGRDGVYRRLDPPMRFVVAMYRLYGRRKGETLKLLLQSAQRGGEEPGLHFRRGKDRAHKPIIIRWDAQIERHWGRLMRWRAQVARGGKLEHTAALLNRKGRPLTVSGVNSAWKRAMHDAGLTELVGTEVVNGKERKVFESAFTLHDIRKTRASTAGSLQEAQHLLAHDDQRTTSAIYRLGPHVIDRRKA